MSQKKFEGIEMDMFINSSNQRKSKKL